MIKEGTDRTLPLEAIRPPKRKTPPTPMGIRGREDAGMTRSFPVRRQQNCPGRRGHDTDAALKGGWSPLKYRPQNSRLRGMLTGKRSQETSQGKISQQSAPEQNRVRSRGRKTSLPLEGETVPLRLTGEKNPDGCRKFGYAVWDARKRKSIRCPRKKSRNDGGRPFTTGFSESQVKNPRAGKR